MSRSSRVRRYRCQDCKETFWGALYAPLCPSCDALTPQERAERIRARVSERARARKEKARAIREGRKRAREEKTRALEEKRARARQKEEESRAREERRTRKYVEGRQNLLARHYCPNCREWFWAEIGVPICPWCAQSEGIDPEQEWEEIELDLPNHPDYADRYVRTQIRAMARETHDAEREMVIPKLPLIDSKGCRERLFRGWPRDRAFLDAFES